MCYYEEPQTPSNSLSWRDIWARGVDIRKYVQIKRKDKREEPPFSEGDLVRTKCDIGTYKEGTLALVRGLCISAHWPVVEVEFQCGKKEKVTCDLIEIVMKKRDNQK